MIINPSKSRLMIFIISSLAFLIFTISVFIKSSFIALIDAAEQNLLANFTPAALLRLTTPFVMFSHGILFALLIFIFMFVLWGLKFKIPAAWILLTTLLGWLIVNVFSLIFNHQVAGKKTEYPAHTIFFATLLYFFLAKIVIPELKTIFYRIVGQVVIVAGWLLTFTGTILLNNYTLSGAIAGWLLALAWLQLAAQFYGKSAPRAYRMNGFSNSWF